jgi:hypothetical protein|tara:strand:+ start:5603 stop:9913 length:4311 start_codon:yes stop_codon:yes gene_type:complete
MADIFEEYLSVVRDEPLATTQPQTETNSSFSAYANMQQQPERPQESSYSDAIMLDYRNKIQKNPEALTIGRSYTLDDLEKNDEFQTRAERFMESIGADEEIFEYLRDTDFSLSSAFVRSGEIKGWSEEAKADYRYLRNVFDNAEIGSTRQYLQLAGDMAVDLIADPINWLSAAFFVPTAGMSSAAALSAKQVAKQGLKKVTSDSLQAAKRPAIVGAAEGSVWAGAHDYFLQKADVELDLKDQVDIGQTALSGAFGLGFGGAFGGALGAFSSMSPRLSEKISKYSDEDAIIKQAEKVDRKVEEEAFGVDKATDELVVKPDKEKRLRKRDQLLANTFGKYTSQFVGMAQNSKTLQRLLGNFRYDWARTFKEGAKGLERESYGLALSERTHGYLFKMRDALNPLNREVGLRTAFNNTLNKKQNDDLGYLLRLTNKEFNSLVESGKADYAGPAVVQSAIQIRETLNEIFEEGVSTGLLTRSQFVDHFFPRHFSHSKIKADKDGLINIIKDSEHSLPQNTYADDAYIKAVRATGKEEEVLRADARWIDQEVFERDFVKEVSKGKTSVYDELTETQKLTARELKATQIVNNMLEKRHTPFQFGTKDNAGGGHQFLQHRVFSKIDDNILAPYLENDVEKVLEAYVTDASRAITRTQFFGKTKAAFEKKFLIPIRNELRKEKIDEDEIDETIRRLRLMHERVTGLDTDQIRVKNKYGVGALDFIKLSQQMAHLPLATLSSLTEPLILLTRIDSVGGKFAASKEVGKSIVKGVKKDVEKIKFFARRVSGKEVKGFADMQDEYWQEAYKVGLAMEQAVMDRIESLTGEALEGGFAKKMQNAFFKANFLSSWTGSVQLAAFTTGKRIIREHARDLHLDATGVKTLSKSKKEYIKKHLDGLGVHDRFAREWYARSLDKDGVFDEGRGQGTASSLGKFEQKKQIAFYKNHYQKGANRFTREIILNPSTAEANRPLWFSHPAGQILAQFAGYPTVFNNTILKRWINEGLIENKRQTSARIAGTALAMTSIAVFMNAVRSGGRSLEEDDGTIVLEAVQRWGGLGPADYAYRFHQNATYGSGQAGALLKTPTGPIVSDVFDSVLYRKGLVETLYTNVPFYSALPKDIRDSMKKSGRGTDKAVWGSMFPTGTERKQKGRFAQSTRDYSFAKGGIVDIPNASEEPDEKKVRGMPFTYAELGGVLAKDVEDRRGFALGGIANKIADTTKAEQIRNLTEDSHKDDVIRHLTKEIRKAEPIFESDLKNPLYKKVEASFFTEAVKEDVIRYVDSDFINVLDEELQYAANIGPRATTKPRKSGGKKIKYIGKLSVVNPLELGQISEDQLTGSEFTKLLQDNKEMQDKLINGSRLEKQDAKQLVKNLLNDYTDTQKLIQDFAKHPPEVTKPLLDIKQSTQLRNTLTDLGYDSIHANDDYILFDNAQFKVTKKLTKKNRTI